VLRAIDKTEYTRHRIVERHRQTRDARIWLLAPA